MRSPPTTDMTMAPISMRRECARTTGRAVHTGKGQRSDCHKPRRPSSSSSSNGGQDPARMGEGAHTNTHNHEKAREEAAQVQHGGAPALDKVVGVGAAAAYPVRYGRDDVRRHDKQ